MLTMNAVDSNRSQSASHCDLAASGTRLRPHSRWLAAAATAQRRAAAMLADADIEPRRSVDPLIDAWTSLALATWPDAHVPSDRRLVERAEALLLRQGEPDGERARTWVELSTLLAARRGGEGSALPLRRTALAAHTARLGRLIAAPRRAAPARRRLRQVGLVLLGLVALAAWLAMQVSLSLPANSSAAPAAQPRLTR